MVTFKQNISSLGDTTVIYGFSQCAACILGLSLANSPSSSGKLGLRPSIGVRPPATESTGSQINAPSGASLQKPTGERLGLCVPKSKCLCSRSLASYYFFM